MYALDKTWISDFVFRHRRCRFPNSLLLGGGGGGGGCTRFLTNFWRNFDQPSEDLILTNQYHFKAIFSVEGKVGGGGGVKANTIETEKYETSRFSRRPKIWKGF